MTTQIGEGMTEWHLDGKVGLRAERVSPHAGDRGLAVSRFRLT